MESARILRLDVLTVNGFDAGLQRRETIEFNRLHAGIVCRRRGYDDSRRRSSARQIGGLITRVRQVDGGKLNPQRRASCAKPASAGTSPAAIKACVVL